MQGRGRIEKTEIVEMAIKHIKHLHQLMENQQSAGQSANGASADKTVDNKNGSAGSNWQCPQEVESFKSGFNECMAEALYFFVEKESIPPGKLYQFLIRITENQFDISIQKIHFVRDW